MRLLLWCATCPSTHATILPYYLQLLTQQRKKAKGGILSIQESVTAANTLPIDIDALSEDILISGCVYLPLPPYLRCVVLNVFFTWRCSSTRCCEVWVEPLILFSSGGHSPFPFYFLHPLPLFPLSFNWLQLWHLCFLDDMWKKNISLWWQKCAFPSLCFFFLLLVFLLFFFCCVYMYICFSRLSITIMHCSIFIICCNIFPFFFIPMGPCSLVSTNTVYYYH